MVQDGRRVPVASFRQDLRQPFRHLPSPSRNHFRALPDRIRHVCCHLLHRRSADQWPQLRLGRRPIARPQRFCFCSNQRRKLVGDRLVHERAVDADARLPGVAKGGGDDPARGELEVGVGEDQKGGVAS